MDFRSFFQILPLRIPYANVASPPETLPLPSKAVLTWKNRVPADLSVRVGDTVTTGQVLTRPGKGFFVSTVTGRVEEITPMRGPDGEPFLAVEIRVDSRETLDPSLKAMKDPAGAPPAELRRALQRAGFPTLNAISDDPGRWPRVDVLIISGMDMDPAGIASQQALRDQTEAIEAGIQLFHRATQASRCVVAIPGHLSELARRFSRGSAEMIQVPAYYPNGLPEILVRKWGAGSLMRRGNETLLGNTVVMGVEEAAAAAGCLANGAPLLLKTVTVSAGKGGALANVRARIGTPVTDLIKHRGVQLLPKGKLIMDGLLRGHALFSDDQPVSAQTESVHVQAPGEVFFYEQTPCTSCGKCNDVCPVDLEAGLLGRFSEYGIFAKCRVLGAENCIECGLCAYVCPARRPLVQLIAHAKHVIQTQAVEQMGMEEALACKACGPTCPAIRLFEAGPVENVSSDKNRE